MPWSSNLEFQTRPESTARFRASGSGMKRDRRDANDRIVIVDRLSLPWAREFMKNAGVALLPFVPAGRLR